MQDFDTTKILEDDKIEITDLDSQNDGFSGSLSLLLLRLIRKIPLFASTRTRSTALALLTCMILLLFLVQPGLPDLSRQPSSTSALFTSSALDVQSPLPIIEAHSTNKVTWIKISNGSIIEIQANPGTIVWHNCKVQHWFIPRKYAHPTVVICK
jgi:hypothetical protein